jgi:hypothetical protein
MMNFFLINSLNKTKPNRNYRSLKTLRGLQAALSKEAFSL